MPFLMADGRVSKLKLLRRQASHSVSFFSWPSLTNQLKREHGVLFVDDAA